MIIKNYTELATTELRSQALQIIEAGIAAVQPKTILSSKLDYNAPERSLTVGSDKYELAKGRLFVVGGGKAAGAMAVALEHIIPVKEITAGLVLCTSSDYKTKKIKVVAAGHPLPDESGIAGVEQMLALKEQYGIAKSDLVLCLLSGGGSALMSYPMEGISIQDLQEVTSLLLASGANIQEMNIIRKHLSRVKGGRLGQFFAPAKIISLIISDVVGNDISSIASGPAYPDSTTFEDAYAVLKRYGLLSKVPANVKRLITTNRGKEDLETPKTLDNCSNYILADNQLALDLMVLKARALGLKPLLVTSSQTGETGAVAYSRAGEILGDKFEDYNALLLGGETTPRLPENAGKGGRNQHFAGTSMLAFAGHNRPWVLASMASDGTDYQGGIAGAIIDNDSITRAEANGLDVRAFIENYDSYKFFETLGAALIKSSNTGTNVGDLMVYLLG